MQRLQSLEIEIPVDSDGNFDIETQKALASVYDSVVDSLRDAASQVETLASLQPEVMFAENEESDGHDGQPKESEVGDEPVEGVAG